MTKKPWKKPELTVLTVSRAEEAVLVVCKVAPGPESGPISTNEPCYSIASCILCSLHAPS